MGMLEFDRDSVQTLALGRMAFGVGGFLAPKLFGRAWIGSEGRSGRVAVVTRAFGIRDFALGLGTYLAVQKEAPVRGWIEAGLLCDAGDVVANLISSLPALRKIGIVAMSGAAVAAGVLALQNLEDLKPSS